MVDATPERASRRDRWAVARVLAGTGLLAVAFIVSGASRASNPTAVHTGSRQQAQRVDYLTFAQGAIPIAVGGAGAGQGAAFEHAVAIVDGEPAGFTMVNRADSTTDTEFTYELPAPTTFDRFAVPNVLETPSPSQTFTRVVEVHGSSTGPNTGFRLLATGRLETHAARGLETELQLMELTPVRWITIRLVGGIEMLRDDMFLEFSEIIGNGVQETPPLSDRFDGVWQGRGVLLELHQEGAIVTGCYDRRGDLQGTVSGSLLRATGLARSTGVPSAFVLNVADDGTLRGLASTNGAPFRIYTAPTAPPGADTDCADPGVPMLGCGSVLHSINFDFDSAGIRPESEPTLDALFEGLREEPNVTVVIEGHTSNEGDNAYNLDLSERRAQAVVDALIERGLGGARLSAVGRGESQPVAPNDDESGRSLNRRVAVVCSSAP